MIKNDNYCYPKGFSGAGSDIKWCGRWSGGKRCLLCKHYAKFEVWSQEWKWYYLMSWHYNIKWGRSHWSFEHVSYRYFSHKHRFPPRYNSTGLTENDMKSLLNLGSAYHKY